MKKIFRFIQDSFELSYRETRDSLIFLTFVISFALAGISVNQFLFTSPKPIELGDYELKAKQLIAQKEAKKVEYNTTESKKNLRTFNPNTAEIKDLTSMGVPFGIASRLVNFRKKGMNYKRKEDLLKVYGMNDEWYDKLEPFVDLPSGEERNDYSNFERIYEPEPFEKPKYHRPKEFDINKAGINDFTTVYGIGEVFASRIIKYREALGGFHDISQVKFTSGLSQEAFDSLKVVAKIVTTHKKVNINEIEIGEFRHPYLKSYQIKGIVNYRNQHGDFESAKDLEKLKVLDLETINNISPYFSFEKRKK